MNAVIEVNHLSKSFFVPAPALLKKRLWSAPKCVLKAVDDISFSIEEGERVAFVGPNGAGKSTTLKMLTSILYPTAGEARILGLAPWKERKKLAYQIGAVFGQRSQLWQHLSPLHTFRLLAAIYDIPDAAAKRRIDELIESFEFSDFIGKPVRMLSLGERMRCEIVASLLHRPRVLFLDEPTIGLDVVAKGVIRKLLRQMNKKLGTTFLLTSHDTGDMENVCDRVIIINHGRIVLDESVSRLKSTWLKRKIVTTVNKVGERKKIKIDTAQEPIEAALTRLLGRGDIVDMTVEDPPMEDIIREIYGRYK